MGLERVRALLALADDPQHAFRSILVGGSNGKGSAARALSEILAASGLHVGLYTSPHLSRIGERFMVAGRELERSAVAAAVERLRPDADRLRASFFEVLTAAACLLFAEDGVHSAVMEVGLGGRFDATNALEPALSIVTGIALDHVELLGSSEAAIAGEKAGIFRSGKLALTGARGDALSVLHDQARQRGAILWADGEEIRIEGEDRGWEGVRVGVECPAGEAGGASSLVGAHQLRNLGLAAAASLALGAAPEHVERGLAATRWPGRLERLEYQGRWLVFDGAHNAQAARALAMALASLLPEGGYSLVVGMARDKDRAAFARALGPGAASVIATRASYSPRALPAEELAREFSGKATAISRPGTALARAIRATRPGGTVVVAGSLYLVGELRPHVTGEVFEAERRWQ